MGISVRFDMRSTLVALSYFILRPYLFRRIMCYPCSLPFSLSAYKHQRAVQILHVGQLVYCQAVGVHPSGVQRTRDKNRQLLHVTGGVRRVVRKQIKVWNSILNRPILLDRAVDQIGQDELRLYFHLMPQQINFEDLVKEEPQNPSNWTVKNLEYLQSPVYSINKGISFHQLFWPEDIDIATRFLDRKFPAIRQLLKAKYQEETGLHKIQRLDKATIDKTWDIFDHTAGQISGVINKMITQSSDPFISRRRKSKCSV